MYGVTASCDEIRWFKISALTKQVYQLIQGVSDTFDTTLLTQNELN